MMDVLAHPRIISESPGRSHPLARSTILNNSSKSMLQGPHPISAPCSYRTISLKANIEVFLNLITWPVSASGLNTGLLRAKTTLWLPNMPRTSPRSQSRCQPQTLGPSHLWPPYLDCFGPISVFIRPEPDHWLCLSLTDSLLFSELDWCDPGVWRCQLKTCWGCFYCCCWCLEMVWR